MTGWNTAKRRYQLVRLLCADCPTLGASLPSAERMLGARWRAPPRWFLQVVSGRRAARARDRKGAVGQSGGHEQRLAGDCRGDLGRCIAQAAAVVVFGGSGPEPRSVSDLQRGIHRTAP